MEDFLFLVTAKVDRYKDRGRVGFQYSSIRPYPSTAAAYTSVSRLLSRRLARDDEGWISEDGRLERGQSQYEFSLSCQ